MYRYNEATTFAIVQTEKIFEISFLRMFFDSKYYDPRHLSLSMVVQILEAYGATVSVIRPDLLSQNSRILKEYSNREMITIDSSPINLIEAYYDNRDIEALFIKTTEELITNPEMFSANQGDIVLKKVSEFRLSIKDSGETF